LNITDRKRAEEQLRLGAERDRLWLLPADSPISRLEQILNTTVGTLSPPTVSS